MIENEILPRIGQIKVAAVTTRDVEDLHRGVSKRAPIRANRVLAVASKMFSLAVSWEYRRDNPCRGTERNLEHKRDRYYSPAEIARLNEALGDYTNQVAANAVRFLMLTGARRGEVLSAQWNHIDLVEGIWTKPSAHTKQQREHRIPISRPAMQLLTEMRTSSSGESDYIFPGRVAGRPLTDLKKVWAFAVGRAGLHDARLHDLRHSFASILVSSGSNLPLIGAMLGHTQPQTTARYAHLYDAPLREAAEKVGAVIEAATDNAE